MQIAYLLGLIGSAMLTLGVFLPIISFPIVGSMNYFKNGEGDGTLILLLAVTSLFLTFRRRFEWLFTTGIASLAMLVVTFIVVRMKMSSISEEMESKLAGNPFRSLALLCHLRSGGFRRKLSSVCSSVRLWIT